MEEGGGEDDEEEAYGEDLAESVSSSSDFDIGGRSRDREEGGEERDIRMTER